MIETLPDETLVYDLERDVAHCLNHTAALVWRRCDGTSTTKQIARSLTKDLDQPVDENLVWLALDQLERNRLLQDAIAPHRLAMNRRDAVRAIGLSTVVAVPVVASILAPAPAQAASCLPNTASCGTGAECCSGFCISGQCGTPPP